MTDTPTPPEGWYPDPAGSGGLRRWDGHAWTADVRPSEPSPAAEASAPAAPPAPPAPPAPAPAPAPAAAPAPAPAYPPAPSAPAYPGASSTPGYPGAPAYPASGVPAYPAAPPAPSTTPHVRGDIPTNTVWIWLVVALPLVSVLSLFLFDWRTYLQESIYASAFPEQAPYAASSSLVVSAGASVISLIVVALTVLFSFLDWRQLRARGIQKPFHWAWSFFVLAISSGGVYIIGRAVILRRQTGKGLGPVWGWIGVTLATLIIGAIWVAMILSAVIPLIEQLQYYGY